jgi:hypothetical protein
MKVEVRLTESEKNVVPDWQEEVAIFQRRCDEMGAREKFCLCLHEAGHMAYNRRLGWSVEKLFGPHTESRQAGSNVYRFCC